MAAYKKDYGYKFHGWRGGVMVVEGRDGTLWSGLTGVAFRGPQAGRKLERVPSLTMTWRHWLMLHPESTAYDLFDGTKYQVTELPSEMHAGARASMSQTDPRLPESTFVLGVEIGQAAKAFPLNAKQERSCFVDTVAGKPLAVFWYGPTKSATAYESVVDGRSLSFVADEISPETAPFKDRETGTRWTLAGRGVDGPLRGKELTWISSVQCRWFAWSGEHPETQLHVAQDQ